MEYYLIQGSLCRAILGTAMSVKAARIGRTNAMLGCGALLNTCAIMECPGGVKVSMGLIKPWEMFEISPFRRLNGTGGSNLLSHDAGRVHDAGRKSLPHKYL
jgi:hypothetical protein